MAAGTFGVLLRNGQTWQRVELLEMDQWSLLLETERGRVLLPNHAVDADLLDPAQAALSRRYPLAWTW